MSRRLHCHCRCVSMCVYRPIPSSLAGGDITSANLTQSFEDGNGSCDTNHRHVVSPYLLPCLLTSITCQLIKGASVVVSSLVMDPVVIDLDDAGRIEERIVLGFVEEELGVSLYGLGCWKVLVHLDDGVHMRKGKALSNIILHD